MVTLAVCYISICKHSSVERPVICPHTLCLPKFEDGRFCWYENNYVGKVGVIFISFVVNMLRKIHISRRIYLDQEGKVKVLSHAKVVVYRIAFFVLFVTYCTEYLLQNHPYASPGLSRTVYGPQRRDMFDIPKGRLWYQVSRPKIRQICDRVMVWRIKRRQTNQRNTHIREN